MDKNSLKKKWDYVWKHKFLYLATFIFCMGLSWQIMGFVNSETISAKDDALLTKDTIISDKNSLLEQYEKTINDKNDLIEELRLENLKKSIRNDALNISILNSNIQTTSFTNWSCSEKDIIIDEFATKITSQDEALKICKQNLESSRAEINELQIQIPEYNKGFVGNEFSVYQGSSYQADGGKFIVSVIDTESNGVINRYQTSFKLNGVSHTKTVGDSVIFDYYGQNYTLNLRSTSNPAKFYVYMNED